MRRSRMRIGLAHDEDDGPFDLGISAGEPGLSVKYFTSDNMALEATVGWSFL